MSLSHRQDPETRRAILVCEVENVAKPHDFVGGKRASNLDSGYVSFWQLMFRCQCGAVRVWGNSTDRVADEYQVVAPANDVAAVIAPAKEAAIVVEEPVPGQEAPPSRGDA